MEKTKNFFENWAETQKTMFDNWAEKTQEFQQNVTGGHTFAKGTEMYQDWLNKQKENIKSFTKGAEKTAEDVKGEATHTFDNFLEQWKGFQEKTTEMWSEASKKMNDFFSGFGVNPSNDAAGFANTMMDNARKYSESWMDAIKNMTGTMKMPFGASASDFSGKTIFDAYNMMQKGSENFTKLYELWAPVFKASQNNIFSVEEYKKLMNPIVYKELMDKMFGFDALNPLKHSYDQYIKSVTSWYEKMSGSAKENYNSFKTNMEQFANTLPKNQEFFADMFKNINTQFQASASPFFKLMPEGKEKDQIMQMNKLAEFYTTSANKLANLQYLVYTTGAKVNEKLMEDLANKAKDGKVDADFTAFYNNWISANGKAFEDLFHTDEFSKLQGELVTLDAEIKTNTDKLMETALAPYPVVLKSQLDELYKTNYELKKQVYEMGKQLATMVKSSVSTEKAPKATAEAAVEVKHEAKNVAPKAAVATAATRKK